MEKKMKKILYILLLLNLFIPIFSEDFPDISLLWPLPDNYGEISFRYGEIIEEFKDSITGKPNYNTKYFITSKEGMPILAAADGIVTAAESYTYYFDSSLNSRIYYDDIEELESSRFKAKFDFQHDQLMGRVQLDIGSDLNISYLGLVNKLEVEVGDSVKKGDIIGYAGYLKAKYEDSHIAIYGSYKRKTYDIGPLLGVGKGKEIDWNNDVKPADYQYPVKDLQNDFNTLRNSLEEGHPGLYTYKTKTQINDLFTQYYKNIDSPMTGFDFFRQISPLIPEIRCVHTQLMQRKGSFNSVENIFPGRISFIGDKCYILENYSKESTIPRFSEILTIDEIAISEIYGFLEKRISSDGYSETGKAAIINSFFHSLFPYYFGEKETYVVLYKRDDSEPISTIIQSVKRDQQIIENSYDSSISVEDDLAILNIESFLSDRFDTKNISSFFKDLKGNNISNLIIDLRKNGGGDPANVERLFSYFADSDFSLSEYEYVNSNTDYSFFDDTSNYSGVENYYTDEYFPIDGKDGFFSTGPLYKPNQEFHFDGDVFILTSGLTFSASGIFCSLMLKNNKAIFIGEETGACYYELNGTKFPEVILQNTGIKLKVPLIKTVFTTEKSDKSPYGRGIIPDYPIKTVLENYINGVDPQMDFVKKLIFEDKNVKQKLVYIIVFILILLIISFFFLKLYKKRI